MKNPEADRDNARNWAANNPDRRKEIANNYARRNKDKTRKYSQEHREENNARTLRYSKEHPEVKRAVKIKRRAKLTAAGGDYSPGELRQQFASQDGLCYWCSTPLDAKYHSDHYIPISKGGSGYAANIVCSCPRCNRWKHDKMPDVFMEELRAEGIAGLWCAHTAQNHMEE
jgi:5-methylcytosine-specific restriction endonuclease McrA